MKKQFVLDTNVIMSDPYSPSKFDGDVVITYVVLSELDHHKTDKDEVGRNVREFARLVDKNFFPNIVFDNIVEEDDDLINDDKIIISAHRLNAVLVTNDILMSIKAKTVGLKVERYDVKNVENNDLYSGILNKDDEDFDLDNVYPNEFILNEKGLFTKKDSSLKRLAKDKSVWGVKHRNLEQKCAIHALLDDDIKLVTLSGQAGTGKTLLAIAVGLEKVVSESKYQKLLVSRPVVPMGQDIGYLPGDINEKLGPWMQPIFDNIEFLFNIEKGRKNSVDAYMELSQEGLLKVEALTYIRGRSIPKHFIIIDEAQNLTRHEVKTIISRAGEDTKIILTGDPNQIDNPKLDSVNNGLTYVVEKFKDQKIAAHITLTKCERSELADVAAKIL